MADNEPNIELAKLAVDLTRSSNVYSEALARVVKQTASVDAISQAVTGQFDIERRLLRSTDAMLKQMRLLDAISPSIQSMVSANASFTRMAERLASIENAHNAGFRKIFDDHARIQKMIQGIGLTESITAAFARIDTTRMLSASLAAQSKLATFDDLEFGRLAGLDAAFSRAISTNLGNLTRSYQSLINVAATRESLASRLPLITTYAPVEYYREIEVVEAITVGEEDKLNDDEPIDTAIAATLPSVDGLLSAFDERLVLLLHGARQSLRDDNPDRARHVTTSVRELLTQILHALAPDDDVRRWTSNNDHYHNNRPTRRARLLFICRHIDCDPLSRFVEDDVRAALSFVDSLNSGTHVVESRLSYVQLSSIVARMESLIVFLLQLRNQ
jgi:Predicted pPIWI-associating nuclease